jgi:hypothetical protein
LANFKKCGETIMKGIGGSKATTTAAPTTAAPTTATVAKKRLANTNKVAAVNNLKVQKAAAKPSSKRLAQKEARRANSKKN